MFVHEEEYGVEGRTIFNLKIICLLCKNIILVTTYKLVVGVKFEAERRDVLIVLVSSINLDTISVETTWEKNENMAFSKSTHPVPRHIGNHPVDELEVGRLESWNPCQLTNITPLTLITILMFRN